MKQKNTIYAFLILTLFLLSISSVNALIYINNNNSVFISYDDLTFQPIILYNQSTFQNSSVSSFKNISSSITGMCSDLNGKTLVILDGTRVLVSYNYGQSFNYVGGDANTLTQNFNSIACNHNLTSIVLTTTNTVYVSNDKALNFFNRTLATTSLHISSVSADGKKIIIGELIGGAGLWISNTSGQNFTKINILGAGYYTRVCADNGIYYAIAQTGQNKYISYDGVNWISKSAGRYTDTFNNEMECNGNNSIISGGSSLSSIISINNFTTTNNTLSSFNNNKTYFYEKLNGTFLIGVNASSSGFGNAIYYSIDNGFNWDLYNNLSALGFNQVRHVTISDQFYTPIPDVPICVNEHTYCSNASYNVVTDTYQCSFLQTQNCAQGCYNVSGQPYCNNTVANECNVIGSRICSSTTTFNTCDDIDQNGVYEYYTTDCAYGQYCQPVGDFYATCSDLVTGTLNNNTFFSVTPYNINDDFTNYENIINTKTINVYTSLISHDQKFKTNAPQQTFTARDCNYKEANVYTDNQVVNVRNYTRTFNPIAQTSYVSINLLPSTLNITDINITSSNNQNIARYLILRNTSQKSLTIYQANGSVYYTDISLNSYDDLFNVNIYTVFDFVSSTRTTKIIIDRETDRTITLASELFTGSDYDKINITTTTALGVQIKNVSINTISEPTYLFYQNIPNDFGFLPCVYNTGGSYKVRTYNSALGYPDYTNFIDYNVNINGLGLTAGELDAVNVTDTLGKGGKLLLALLISLVVALVLGSIGSAVGMGKVGFMVGIVFFFLTLVGFSLMKWVNVGWIIVAVVLAVGLGALVLTKGTSGNQTG